MFLTDEMIKADKTKLAKLITSISNREFPSKCEDVRSLQIAEPAEIPNEGVRYQKGAY